MKAIAALSILMLACSAVFALEKYDPSASGNVPIRVTLKSTGKTGEGKPKRTYSVTIDRAEYVASETWLEFYFAFEEKGKMYLMPAEKEQITKMPCSLEFTKQAKSTSLKYVGWVARVVRDGKIIGVSGDNPERTELAENDELFVPVKRIGKPLK